MGYPYSRGSTVSRSKYWMWFFGVGVGSLVLLAYGVFAVLQGHFLTAFLAVILILPLGIYYRVVQMRRCRAIGWPTYLPWAFLAANFVSLLFDFANIGAAARYGAPVLGLGTMAALADMVFSIAIGCIRGRSGFDTIWQPPGDPTVPSYRDMDAPSDEIDFEAAIERAMKNYRETGSAEPRQPARVVTGSPDVHSRSAGSARPAPGGFGRRGL